jgi:hypothetical protein
MATIRMQFEVPTDKANEIETLIKECGFESKKEFFNNAITLLKWAVRHVKNGETVAAVNPREEKYTELSMPFLDTIREQSRFKIAAAE